MSTIPKAKVPFIGPAYAFSNLSIAVQELINYYLEIEVSPGQQRDPVALRGAPGLVDFSSTSGATRALETFDNLGALFAVCGNSFGSVSRTGEFTALGTVQGSGQVWMRELVVYIIIADQPFDVLDGYAIFPGTVTWAYVYNKQTAAFVSVTDGDFASGDINEFFISQPEDPINYDGLDYVAVNARFNVVKAIVVCNREVIIFGSEIIDFWFNSGNELFPFERISGKIIELGVNAPGSIVRGDDTVYFLAKNKKIYRIAPGGIEPISTPIINEDLEAHSDLDLLTARGFYYNWKGHQFYCLTLSNGKTWVYDNSVGPADGWSRRKSADIDHWRGSLAAEAYGHVYVGDYTNSTIWELDDETYTEGDDELEAIRTGNYIHVDQKSFKVDHLELVFKENADSLDDDPGVFVSFTKDGGNTFSDERERKFSDTRLFWRNNGNCHKSIAFKSRVTARRNRDIVAAVGKLVVGNDR